ncbi:MAG: hypothetical protein FWG01_04155 [Betaproteobacteria bacterium]|nr:hypothetical protein [Betaproteobacteria bacterium]
MNTSTGKTLSEFSVHLRSWGAMALPASQLRVNMDFGEKMNRVLSDSHIYVLCKRPVFSFDPDTFLWSQNRVTCDLVCKVKGVSTSIHFEFDLPLKENEAMVALAPSPHREIRVLDEKGECVRILTAMGLSQHPAILRKDPFPNDLEVLYVGNVFEEGKTSVFERICRNEPLQNLVVAMQQALPDDEIIIYVFEYLPYELLALFGRLQHQSKEEGPGETRFVSIKDHPLTEHQKICLAQGGLIYYFRPDWQEPGGKMMPDAGQAVFQACEKLDMAGLVVEISTVRSHFRLYSASSALLPHHMTMINLSDSDSRAAFFSMKI